MDAATRTAARGRILAWYDREARDLPWRGPGATAWGILVSEVMLQQTPVHRVLGPWAAWLERWPSPSHLAASATGDAVAAWGRLGYPRRALRLHEAAAVIVARHDGEVPTTLDELRALPGVGEYTAAAVASFAFGQRHLVLDTNVRRVLARTEAGVGLPAPSITVAERELARAWLPDETHVAARWAVAAMELGALVCTAVAPRCGQCPVQDVCRWVAEGQPDAPASHRRRQAWHGTDRQCRGLIIQALRDAGVPLSAADIVEACGSRGWEDPDRVAPLLRGLVAERLVHVAGAGYALHAEISSPPA